MATRFGWHSGALKCRSIETEGNLTIKGSMSFGDASVDTLAITGLTTIATNQKIQFRDTGLYMNSGADGKLTISSDGTGADDITLSGTVTFDADVTGLVSSVTDAGHTHNTNSALNFGQIQGTLGVATDYMGGAYAAASASETDFFLCPAAGNIVGLFGHLGTAPGGADTVVVTLRVNGAGSISTFTISAANVVGSDITHTVAVVSGDRLSISVVSSAGTAANLKISALLQIASVTATTGVTVATV